MRDAKGGAVVTYIERRGRVSYLLFSFFLCTSNRTPLHLAVELGDLKSLDALLAAGARVNVSNREGATPLHACVALNHTQPELRQRLLAAGAHEAWRDFHGRTPAHALALATAAGAPAPPAVASTTVGVNVGAAGSFALQICSDLHVEFFEGDPNPLDFVKPSAPHLVYLTAVFCLCVFLLYFFR